MTVRIPRRRFLELSAAASLVPLMKGCDGTVPDGDAGTENDAGVVLEVNPDDYDGGVRVADTFSVVDVDDAVFFLGVSAGMPTASGAKLWTKTTAPTVTLVVWRDTDEDDTVVVAHTSEVVVDDDKTTRVDVDGLAPATWYHYAFFVTDVDGARVSRSIGGRVRTAFPDDWRAPVTFAAATCTRSTSMPWEALSLMANEGFDAFLHLGDMSYNDGAVTRAEYDAKWEQALDDAGYRDILRHAGMYATWDDHEITNDLDPTTINEAHLLAAKDSYFAHIPVTRNSSTTAVGGTTFTSVRWGHTAEIIVLDSRTLRTPDDRSTSPTAYLGVEQTAFLKNALLESPCHFKVILNSVPITRMPELWALAGDRWQGYGPQRNDLLLFLEDNLIENVWFIAGDFHMGFVGHVENEGYGRRFREIAVGPTGNLGNPLGLLAENDEYRESVFPAAQFSYGRGKLAATLLTFDPALDSVRIRFLDARDATVLYDETLRSEAE